MHDADTDGPETPEDAPSGMPEGEPEITPMGVDTDLEDEDGSADEESLPGFPAQDEPDLSG